MPESSLNDKDGYFSHRKATDVGEIDTDVEPPQARGVLQLITEKNLLFYVAPRPAA